MKGYISDKEGRRIVKLTQVKEFTIAETPDHKFKITAWLSNEDFFVVENALLSIGEAQMYLQSTLNSAR